MISITFSGDCLILINAIVRGDMVVRHTNRDELPGFDWDRTVRCGYTCQIERPVPQHTLPG